MIIPKKAQELYNKADQYIDKKKYDKALDFLKNALEIEPNYAEAMSRLGFVHSKLNYKEMSKDEVFELSKRALDLNPTSPITWSRMGSAYNEKKEYDKAIECFEKSIEIDPNNSLSLLKLSGSYFRKGEYDKGILNVKKIPELITGLQDMLSRQKKIYQTFRKFQSIAKEESKLHPNDEKFRTLSTIDLSNIEDKIHDIKQEKLKSAFKEMIKKEIINVIPFILHEKIRRTILKLGVKYTRLQITEIAEKCGEPEDCIIVVAQDMIKNKEIYAEYFKSTKSLVFDQQANIDEIDNLMKKFEEWEKESRNKKL